jgi:hypothetical protein
MTNWFQARWEPGTYANARASRFARLVIGHLCLTAQYDLLSRCEWEAWLTATSGAGNPSYRRDYLRVYLGPGVIPF